MGSKMHGILVNILLMGFNSIGLYKYLREPFKHLLFYNTIQGFC